MHNPWKQLRHKPPYILPDEKEAIETYNQSAKEIHQVRLELPPEPYLGNPESEVVLLNLNPGFSEDDSAFYANEKVSQLWPQNLLHKPLAYPFYMFDPAVPQHTAGPKWWSKKLKEPIQIAGKKTVAQKFCCIEYFPYHSRRYGNFKIILPSQKYNFHLVKKAIARKAIIIVMRRKRAWLTAVPELNNYQLLFQVNNWQNPAISTKNCPEGFPSIENILRQQSILWRRK